MAPPSTESCQPAGSASFESAMSELEGVVASMESGQLTLEASLAAYRRGAELLRFCRSVLEDAQQQIKVLEGDTLRDFPGADSQQ
ncbi:MAG: exodeoxyribonuclease VII small subunit [Betaproteobacteria bacterium]|nr:exodeoxyribonuclease VII small subunit [Betaproteobacteria bacterium]